MFPSPHMFLPNGAAFNPAIAAQLLGQQNRNPRRRRASFAGPPPARGHAQGRPQPVMAGADQMMGGWPMANGTLPIPMLVAGMAGGRPAGLQARRPSFGQEQARPGRNFDPSRIMRSPGRAPSRGRRSSTSTAVNPSPADPLGIGMGGGIPRERRRSFDGGEREPQGGRRSSLVPGGFDLFAQGQNPLNLRADEAALLGLLRGDQDLARGERGYDKVKALKQGAQSEAVNLVRSRVNGKCYIEKRIRTDGDRTALALREIRTLKKVSSKYGGGRNLSVMVDYSATMGGRIYSLILEYCNRGNLQDRMEEIARQRGTASEASVWNVCQGVARGLAFLHDGIKETPLTANSIPKPTGWDTICHLDLKPANIFLDDRGGIAGLPRVILADFGCAVSLSDLTEGREQERQQPCGTFAWYPPEASPGAPMFYGTKTDIYMLGATLHVICRLLEIPQLRHYPQQMPCGSKYTPRLNQFVANLTQMPPKDRMAARNIAPYATQILFDRVQGGRGQRPAAVEMPFHPFHPFHMW